LADPPKPVRTAPLPGARTLTLRPVEPGDVDGLERLYEGLSTEDRYRRFFSVYRPPRKTLEQWAAGEPNGLRLVAVVSDGDERIVADASCINLPDGDAEFALTVDREWRGWLGPYLFDTLAEAAAARGIRNLQADILTENRPMLAVVGARGYAVLSHDGFTEVRLTTGTGPRTPAWPGTHRRPRLLVEAPGGRWRGESEARAAGFQVVLCPGPRPGRAPRCPAVGGEACPLAAGADAIVVALRPDGSRVPALVEAHCRLHHHVPLFVEMAPEDAAMLPVPDDARLVDRSVPVAQTVAALSRAVAPAGAPDEAH